jgi:hypothetical protein
MWHQRRLILLQRGQLHVITLYIHIKHLKLLDGKDVILFVIIACSMISMQGMRTGK